MLEVVGLSIVAAAVLIGLGMVIGVPLPAAFSAAVCNVIGRDDCEPVPTPSGDAGTGTPCEAFCPGPDNPIVPTDPKIAATKGNYAALGDSYSSGEGAYDYDEQSDENGCHRSGNAYSQGVGGEYDFQGDKSFVACSGAVTDDILEDRKNGEAPQLEDANINQGTTLVTLSIGGNDLGFGDTIQACATDPDLHWPTEDAAESNGCTQQEDEIRGKMKDLFGPPEPSQYTKTLEAIHEKAPNARIVVVGYPRLFPDPPHDGEDTFNEVDQEFLNGIGAEVNEQIQQHVEALDRKYYGNGQQKMGSFEFVDPTPAFEGHQLSDDDPYINDINLDHSCDWSWSLDCLDPRDDVTANPESIHPNEDGQRAMAEVVNEQIRNGPGRTLYDP